MMSIALLKRHHTLIAMAAIFLVTSVVLYFIHYLIFHDLHHIFIYMLGDIAFLPLEVFLVVIVIERMLARHEKQSILQKLNMVVGAFYSEVGNKLLHELLPCFVEKHEISKALEIKVGWGHCDFVKAFDVANSIAAKPDCRMINLEELKAFLVRKREFLLALVENPNMLENEQFTDLLLATFHLTEELEMRASFINLPDADYAHLSGDIQRVYRRLAAEWVTYAEHLKLHYPYLFSLVVRMNPFKEHPSAVVAE